MQKKKKIKGFQAFKYLESVTHQNGAYARDIKIKITSENKLLEQYMV